VTATRVIDSADAALVRSRGADGDKLALYETTLADLYLAKAREKQGYAQYGDAEILAAEARRFADAASLKAAQRRAGEPVPAPGMSSMVPKQ
jgi:predicted nucleic acid-binding protein